MLCQIRIHTHRQRSGDATCIWLVSLSRSLPGTQIQSKRSCEKLGGGQSVSQSVGQRIHSFVHSFIRSFVRSFVRLFVRWFVRLLRSLVRSLVRSFASFVGSFVRFVLVRFVWLTVSEFDVPYHSTNFTACVDRPTVRPSAQLNSTHWSLRCFAVSVCVSQRESVAMAVALWLWLGARSLACLPCLPGWSSLLFVGGHCRSLTVTTVQCYPSLITTSPPSFVSSCHSLTVTVRALSPSFTVLLLHLLPCFSD